MATSRKSARTNRLRSHLSLGFALTLTFVQLLMFGADSGVLAAVFACLEVLLAAACLVLIGEDVSVRFWRAVGTPLVLIALAMGWAALGAWLSRPLAPDGVGLELAKLCGVLAMIVAGALIGRDRSRFEALALWIAILGLAYTLICLALARADPLTVWGQSKGPHVFRFTGSFTNANAAGCAFGMIALVAMGCVASLIRKHERMASFSAYVRLELVAGAVFAAVLATILTSSRTATVMTIALGGTIILAALRRRKWLRPALVIVIGVCLAAGVTLAMTEVGWRWQTLAVDSAQRAMAYGHYWRLAAARPLFGVGLGGFRALNQAALTPATAPYLWDYGAAHSAILQAALEGGWPYAGLLASAAAALAVPVLAAGSADAPLGGVTGGMIAAAVLAGVCAMDDIALNVPAICALTVFLLGACLGATAPRRRRHPPRTAPSPASIRD